MTVLGGLTGGLWTLGLAAIARSSGPTFTVVGDDDWQVALLEAGSDRILIFSGVFDERVDGSVELLLTTLRQHVDVIVATGSALEHLDRTGPLARSLVVQLDAAADQVDTPWVRALRQQMTISLDAGRLSLERIPLGEWRIGSESLAGWWIRLDLDSLTIVMAPDAETAAMFAPIETALVVVPGGNTLQLLHTLPGAALATNGRRWSDAVVPQVTERTFLVQTFPEDPARFRFDRSRLELPGWSQDLAATDRES
jgi:hypothetical protein